jgi:hypothetical protein
MRFLKHCRATDQLLPTQRADLASRFFSSGVGGPRRHIQGLHVSCEDGPGFLRWHDAAAFAPYAADCVAYVVLREGCALEALEVRQDQALEALDRHRDAVEAAADALAEAGTAQAEALAAACDAMRAAQALAAAQVAEINRQAMAEAEAVADRLESIVGRLVADGAQDVTDSVLARHLGPCVCGPHLVKVAKAARYRGLLTRAALDAMRGGPDTWAAWKAEAEA